MTKDLIFRIAKLAYRYGEIGKPWAQWRTEGEVRQELETLIQKETEEWGRLPSLIAQEPPMAHQQWLEELEKRGRAQRSVI